jgi:hypothetical protein
LNILKKILKIACIVLASLIALLLLAWGGLHVAKLFLYPDYYANGDTVSKIPALGDGFVPQGLDYDPATDTFIHSGYNGKNAELYLVTVKTEKTVVLLTEEGKQATGHAGGVTLAGDYLYISDNEKEGDGKVGFLRIYRASDVLNAADGDSVTAIGRFEVDTSASFCFSDDQYVYVGEFYRAVNYETQQSHYFTTPSGDENKAILSAYPLESDGSISPDAHPAFSISITSQVQGFAVSEDGKVMLSRSWGINPSYLEIHSGWVNSGTTINTTGVDVPLYYLDSSTREQNVTLPAFSEGLTMVDGEVAISFESACNKYIIGKLFFANKVIAYPID